MKYSTRVAICLSLIATAQKAVVSGLESGELALEELSRHRTNECIAAHNVRREEHGWFRTIRGFNHRCAFLSNEDSAIHTVNTYANLGCFLPCALYIRLSYSLEVDKTLERVYRQAAAEFIIVELDLACTFCKLALSADNLVRADRNINNAKHALQTALSTEKRVDLRVLDKKIIDEKIFHVESLIAELSRNSGSRVLSVACPQNCFTVASA